MLLLAIPLGLLIGLSLGTLGGGGSILTVPVLVYVLRQDPHAATASSLLIVGITSLIGLMPHARAGRVRVWQGVVFGALGVVGSFIGSSLSAAVPADLLLLAFAVLTLVVAVVMPLRARRGSGSHEHSDEDNGDLPVAFPLRANARGLLRVVLAATIVGVLTGFFGVGGGFVLVPALTLALGYSMPTAIGTSLLVIVINSVIAIAFRIGQGWELDWPMIGTFTAAAIVGSLLGGRIAGRLSLRQLTTSFSMLLVAVAVYTGASTVAMQ